MTTDAQDAVSDRQLEQRYKRSQIWAGWAQIAASVAALATAFVAIIVARQSQITVDHDTQTALQQSEDTQLSAAITGDAAAGREHGQSLYACREDW